jgi:hypothetical protein
MTQIGRLFSREEFEVINVLDGKRKAIAERVPFLAGFIREYFFTELILRHTQCKESSYTDKSSK